MHVDHLITHVCSAHGPAARQSAGGFTLLPDCPRLCLALSSNRAPKPCPYLYSFLLFQFNSSRHLISKASHVSPDKSRSQLVADTSNVLITSGHISSGAFCLGGLPLSTGSITRHACLRFIACDLWWHSS